MPYRFSWHTHKFHWYQTLKRSKKRYMIQIFQKNQSEILQSQSPKSTYQQIKIQFYGLSLMSWDPRSGPQILGSYPETYSLSQAALMQIYANFLASPDSDFQQFSNQSHFITFQSIPSIDIPAFLIIESTEISGIDSFEKILKKYTQLISQNPTCIFIYDKSISEEMPESFSDWANDFAIQDTFLQEFFSRLNRMGSKN